VDMSSNECGFSQRLKRKIRRRPFLSQVQVTITWLI
jgi:hypothetical protein